jgi:hypothetical protein
LEIATALTSLLNPLYRKKINQDIYLFNSLTPTSPAVRSLKNFASKILDTLLRFQTNKDLNSNIISSKPSSKQNMSTRNFLVFFLVFFLLLLCIRQQFLLASTPKRGSKLRAIQEPSKLPKLLLTKTL